MINTTNPDHMTAGSRLDEVAGILAAGVLRLRSRRGKERAFSRDNCLEVSRQTSPDAIDL